VFIAVTAPNKLTASGFVGYSPINAVGNGMNDRPIKKTEFSQIIPYVCMPREREQMMMIQPEFADDDETDQPTHEFWQKIDELMAKLASTATLAQNRNFEFEDQQLTTIANTPSLNPSIRPRPSSPWAKRFRKPIYSRPSA
jgi:hypothetical protein